MRRALLVTVVAAMLAGCGTEKDPLARISPAPTGPSGAASGAASATPPPQVAQRWKAGMRQYGIAVYWQNNPDDSDQIVRAKAKKILDHVVSLGANSVSISFSFLMDSAEASAVRSDDPITPSPRRLAIVLDEANNRGLRTAVRPMLHERNLATHDEPDIWRGSIRPASRAKWFSSYRDMLVEYGKVAQESKVATFVVGTELNSMESSGDGWRTVAAGLRDVYSGELDYSANHDRLRRTGPAPGISLSVDAYPSVKVGDGATVAQLTAGWNEWLTDNRGSGKLSNLVLAEVAIAARSGAYREPWSPHAKGTIRPEIQQRWFDAACEVMRKRDLAGIYFWMINLDSDPTATPSDKAPMDFVARPGEKNVARCFAKSASRAA